MTDRAKGYETRPSILRLISRLQDAYDHENSKLKDQEEQHSSENDSDNEKQSSKKKKEVRNSRKVGKNLKHLQSPERLSIPGGESMSEM